MELAPVADDRQLVSKRDEARRLLIDSPASLRPVRECSTTVKSSSDRRGILSRMAAVDIDDSESQTSSSCPTSSSSTSTTPSGRLSMSPTVQHDRTRVKSTRISPLAIAAVSGTPSPFQMSVRPMVPTCRVRPLTNVDWCGGGQRHAGSSTSSPGVAAQPSSVQQNRTEDDGGPVRRELEHSSVITVTSPASRRCVVAPTSTVPLSYDGRTIAVDDVLTSVSLQHHDVAESKITAYDNVQQLLHA